MVWYTIIYVIALMISLYLLLSSRHLVTTKRWYDFSFMLGNAFLLWGLSHLLDFHPSYWYQLGSICATYCYSVFLLLAFRTFPLPPHLYYDRWKNNLDILAITVLHATVLLTIWQHPELDEQLTWLTNYQTSVYILGTCFTVFQSSWRLGPNQANNWLLISSMLFLVIDAVSNSLPASVVFVITLCIFAVMLINHYRMKAIADKLMIADDSKYLYQRFTFILRDEQIHWFILFATIAGLLIMKSPGNVYLSGMAVFAGVLLFRCGITRRENSHTLSDLFSISSNLENHFAQNVEQLQNQNKALSVLLDGKQRYEQILQLSYEQNVQQIDYDTLYQLVEEYVHKWYAIVDGFTYVRLAFESADHEVYYDTSQGKRSLDSNQRVIERIEINHKGDSPQKPRYVMVEVEGVVESDQLIFVQQLAVHASRLFQRCIQTQQSLEIHLIEQEMALASTIQSSLIPKERLQAGLVQAKAVYLPMDYVGGDYVDFVVLNERYSCYLVADVSGHGVPASLLTTGIRNLFRAVLQTTISPAEILTRLNQLLYEDLSTTRSFVTMFIAVIDQTDQVIRVSRAGHPCPIYISLSKQMILSCKRGIGLGLTAEATYETEEIPIEENLMLLLYTDGLTDLSRGKETSGLNGWFSKIKETYQLTEPLQDRISSVEQLIFQETSQGEQTDDITVLILDIQVKQAGIERGEVREAL